ncbi:Caveolin-1 [Mactra antiquata]
MAEVDMVNRDPNNINDHLKVSFEDVLGEPDSIHSIDCVWKVSFTCFNCWLNICYKINTLCYGICIAAEWGCEFATVAFYHIWFITPSLRMFEINCAVFKKLYATICGCCVEPCCEACGRVFASFEKR